MAREEETRKQDEVLAALQRDLQAARYARSARKSSMTLPTPRIDWSPTNWSDAGMMPC
ncbi:hypothetical protein [Cupriavidus sp. CP313]